MELTDELKSLFVETAQMLKGSERRILVAQVVKHLGKGGQRRAELELGWNRLMGKGPQAIGSLLLRPTVEQLATDHRMRQGKRP